MKAARPLRKIPKLQFLTEHHSLKWFILFEVCAFLRLPCPFLPGAQHGCGEECCSAKHGLLDSSMNSTSTANARTNPLYEGRAVERGRTDIGCWPVRWGLARSGVLVRNGHQHGCEICSLCGLCGLASAHKLLHNSNRICFVIDWPACRFHGRCCERCVWVPSADTVVTTLEPFHAL